MKPSGPGLLFVGRFLITVLISVLVMGLLRFSVSSWFSFGKSSCLHVLLGRKVMTKLDSMLKSRDATLPTKVHLVKAMVFPVGVYGCESWTIKKAAAAAKLLQSCPTLGDSIDGSSPGSTIPGILQAGTLERVANSFSIIISSF